MCPLIWCRKMFTSKESAARHAVHCPLLSTAWYWCSQHRRPERFLECNKLCENYQKPIPRSKDSIPDLAGRFFKWIWRRQSEKRPGMCSTLPPLKYKKTYNLMLTQTFEGQEPKIRAIVFRSWQLDIAGGLFSRCRTPQHPCKRCTRILPKCHHFGEKTRKSLNLQSTANPVRAACGAEGVDLQPLIALLSMRITSAVIGALPMEQAARSHHQLEELLERMRLPRYLISELGVHPLRTLMPIDGAMGANTRSWCLPVF